MSPDPWTGFLEWLATVLVPSWGELISLLPIVIVGTVVGPILTLLVLMWGWHYLRRRRGRVERREVQPSPVPSLSDGSPAYPANVPYCEEHGLVYPARARECNVDGADLLVACPVDGSVRPASIDTCSACGTRFVLGVGAGPLTVASSDGPPRGGAALA